MRHVEPSGESREAFTKSLLDLADAKFEDMFVHDPELNEYSNNVAQDFCDELETVFTEEKLGSELSSRLHFGIKKTVFLFTNPSDYADTLSAQDIIDFFVLPTQDGITDVERLTEILNTHINFSMALYKPKAEIHAGQQWQHMTQSEKLWGTVDQMVYDIQENSPPHG